MPLTEEMRAAGWIGLDGGPCPVKGTSKVNVLYGERGRANRFEWSWERNKPGDLDIIAYRPEHLYDT